MSVWNDVSQQVAGCKEELQLVVERHMIAISLGLADIGTVCFYIFQKMMGNSFLHVIVSLQERHMPAIVEGSSA